MVINPKYIEFQTVYLKTDPDQFPGIVTGFQVRGKTVKYYVKREGSESCHYEQELTNIPAYMTSNNN